MTAPVSDARMNYPAINYSEFSEFAGARPPSAWMSYLARVQWAVSPGESYHILWNSQDPIQGLDLTYRIWYHSLVVNCRTLTG